MSQTKDHCGGLGMKALSVRLTITERRGNGKTYRYWRASWFDESGRRHYRNLGRAGEGGMGKRAARVKARQLERELGESPRQRDGRVSPRLADYLAQYLADRKGELRPGTLELHATTGRYLRDHFGVRRLDTIRRDEARAFRTALAAGKLTPGRSLTVATVDMHIRNARTIFNRALADDLVDNNPFDRLSAAATVPTEWHYVSSDEFDRLLGAAHLVTWKLLLTLARWAGLRRGEALHLRWGHIDWGERRITVVSTAEHTLKDRQKRIVPIAPALYELLLQAYDWAAAGDVYVIGPEAINARNLSRDFGVLCGRAGVDRYAGPLHTLRKSCLTDWAKLHPAHVVQAWAGHGDANTTSDYYLRVSPAEYDRAAGLPLVRSSEPSAPRLERETDR